MLHSLARMLSRHAKFFALQSVVETQVYPNVATGFSDSNAYLRELTLKSMLVLAPKLSQKTLNQSLLKFLAKLQVSPYLMYCLEGKAGASSDFQASALWHLCSVMPRVLLCEG